MLTVKIMIIKINVQVLVWRLNVSWIWWFYESFWDLVEREKPTLTFFSKLEVLEVSVERCRSTDVLMALTIFRPFPVPSALTRVHFPADQVNITRIASLHKKSLYCWRKVRNKFRERYHCSARFLASGAYFNQLVKYENDSDCSDVDSTDYDSGELVNGKPVVTRSGRQVKRWYGLMF